MVDIILRGASPTPLPPLPKLTRAPARRADQGPEAELEPPHKVDLVAKWSRSTLLLSGVSRRVVVDGESFMVAVFAAAGRG